MPSKLLNCLNRQWKILVTSSDQYQLKNKKSFKICITCSAGGHLKQATTIAKSINYEKYLVTYAAPHLKNLHQQLRIYTLTHPKRNPIRLFQNAIQSLIVLFKEKPGLIISTGADVTVCTSLLGKLLGAKLIYIESGGNVYTPSLTGKILYPFADLFIVQWEPMLSNFKKAVLGGPIL